VNAETMALATFALVALATCVVVLDNLLEALWGRLQDLWEDLS
jgi:hypothetical protein